ncbi:MAG: hypothetical protein AB198_01775 [Parcubacteria bacterium C7867-003]|nr:MAG: hypothetical protein AB198_01775 [Parcubacteria bacterium C7867-003]
MSWYKNVLTKYSNEIKQSAVFSFVLSLIYLLYKYYLGNNIFVWQEVNPIEQPDIFVYYFYSAFTFITIGAFLYHVVKLWKIIYYICVRMFGSIELYKFVKWLVWIGLLGITYFYIVPITINFLNGILSFFYNIYNLILYMSPSVGIFLILTTIGIYILKTIKISKEKTSA